MDSRKTKKNKENKNNKENKEDKLYFYSKGDAFGEFSNFYPSEFLLDGKKWKTSEHYFQAQKFKDIDEEHYNLIFNSSTPFQAFKYGRSKKVPIRDDWEIIKGKVMYDCCFAKFTQNGNLEKKLLETGDKIIVENSPYDYEWGIGRSGNGKNKLGKILMKIREELRRKNMIEMLEKCGK